MVVIQMCCMVTFLHLNINGAVTHHHSLCLVDSLLLLPLLHLLHLLNQRVTATQPDFYYMYLMFNSLWTIQWYKSSGVNDKYCINLWEKQAWSRILFVDPLNFWYWLQKGKQRYRILHWIWTETIQLCNYLNNITHPTPKV